MKKTRFLISLLAIVLCFAACTGNTVTPPASSNDPSASTPESSKSPESSGTDDADTVKTLEIVKDGKSDFKIIYPNKASEELIDSAAGLSNKLNTITGKKITISTDYYNKDTTTLDPDACEILIGATNRPESEEAMATLPESGYSMSLKNNKLIIVGTDDNMIGLALYELEDKVINNIDQCKKGTFTVTPEDAFSTAREPLVAKDFMNKKYVVTTTYKKVVQAYPFNECRVGQGACSDGTYAYFALRNSDDSLAVIVKHDLATGKFVARSEPMHLGHANDMTFDTKNNRIVVVSESAKSSSYARRITTVDPDTLARLDDFKITELCSGITYCPTRDMYAISKGGASLHFFDSNFKLVKLNTRNDGANKKYIVQGMGSDENYIYFIMSPDSEAGTKNNVLVVYDWNAKYIRNIPIPSESEGESMFWVNGKCYAAFNRSGATLYEIQFVIVYA